MLVIVRNAPDTPEGKRGVKLARAMAADLVLLQNGVCFLREDHLEDLGFCGTAYVLEDDRRLRGLKIDAEKKNMKGISYDNLIDLMIGSGKVVGMF
jgi:sulfur transfer complex TusBCD TusB component (DsrH family)